MIIQNKIFQDGQLVIYEDYRQSEHAGAGGCFQIADISIEGNIIESIADKLNIDCGRHYFNILDFFRDLEVKPTEIDYREEIV